jgi:hypothetical protein
MLVYTGLMVAHPTRTCASYEPMRYPLPRNIRPGKAISAPQTEIGTTILTAVARVE